MKQNFHHEFPQFLLVNASAQSRGAIKKKKGGGIHTPIGTKEKEGGMKKFLQEPTQSTFRSLTYPAEERPKTKSFFYPILFKMKRQQHKC